MPEEPPRPEDYQFEDGIAKELGGVAVALGAGWGTFKLGVPVPAVLTLEMVAAGIWLKGKIMDNRGE